MVSWIVSFAFFYSVAAYAVPKCDSKVTGADIDRINKRYDDFFRYRRQLEERDRAREKGRGDLHKGEQAREKALEKARLAYLKNRRPAPDHEAKYEAEMLRHQKERKDELEAARRCYVESQDKAEKLLKRGRMIPGNAEYDLED
jgi:hypothetical protein